ncbi:hypothetical protein ACFVYC_01300 [Pseudarthrobacter sp. NPDC058329]|uniref:hypothetical protein n=1 Tax=Pseudarthrobacter sp. NPDC058329 TaxID=3346448 RepID=UPI0036DF25D9
MRTITEVLAAMGGVASTNSLREAGISRRNIEAGVLDASVQRVARGVFALPNADPVLVHAGRHHAVPGCVTAALAAGLWVVKMPDRAHLAARHGRPIVGCVVHRSNVPPTHLDVVCQSLRCLPPLEGLTIAESAVKKGLVQLPALRERFPAVRERSVRGMVARIRPQSGSIIETDGYTHHSSRSAYREDRQRWNVTVVRGVPTLRVTFEMLLSEPTEFVRMVHQALATYRSAQ